MDLDVRREETFLANGVNDVRQGDVGPDAVALPQTQQHAAVTGQHAQRGHTVLRKCSIYFTDKTAKDNRMVVCASQVYFKLHSLAQRMAVTFVGIAYLQRQLIGAFPVSSTVSDVTAVDKSSPFPTALA
ncbi:MAG: hypothetical protein IPM76_16495 [Chloroflexi bacterium]|nr:hypothetical protein [Chloroflexota bacterium]